MLPFTNNNSKQVLPMTKTQLTPWNGNITIEGNVSYNESTHAWNTIRLHQDIIRQFPTLQKRKAKISFKLEFLRTLEVLKAEIKNIENGKKGVPMLLYLYLDEPLD